MLEKDLSSLLILVLFIKDFIVEQLQLQGHLREVVDEHREGGHQEESWQSSQRQSQC